MRSRSGPAGTSRSSDRRSSRSASTSGWSRPRSAWSASPRTSRSSACTPAGERHDRRRRRRVPVRADGPRRGRADGGRHRRRDVPDAPPARRPARDDARPARRRARARRAARAPLGLGGHDLRPLRLRDGVAVRRGLDPEAALGVRATARARGHASPRRRGRGARALPARLGRRPPEDARDARPHAQLVGVPHPLRGAGRGEGPARSASSSSSATGGPRATPIYRHKTKWTEGTADSDLEVVEAIALDGRPTAEIWRYLLDIDWAVRTTRASCPSTIRSGGCSRRRGT